MELGCSTQCITRIYTNTRSPFLRGTIKKSCSFVLIAQRRKKKKNQQNKPYSWARYQEGRKKNNTRFIRIHTRLVYHLHKFNRSLGNMVFTQCTIICISTHWTETWMSGWGTKGYVFLTYPRGRAGVRPHRNRTSFRGDIPFMVGAYLDEIIVN